MNEAVRGILSVNLFAGWIGMLVGAISGSVIGLYFHRDDWLGGYTSFPRRMVRLAHISFFGLGFINILFALTLSVTFINETVLHISSIGLIIGAITMPTCCYLCAWKKKLWMLFPIPVTSLLVGIFSLLWRWQ